MIHLTGEQKAAAFAEERSLAIVAGAGTGKTRVLTERYLHLVQTCGVEVPRILALTFTEKAAREMKDRIRGALEAASRRDLARSAEFAPISTIHAFLARTLRERALDADLDPRFAIADEITAELLLEQALEETVDGLDAEQRDALVELGGGEETLRSLYLAACATPHEMADLRPVEPDLEELRRRTRRFLEACDSQKASGKTAEKLTGLARIAPRLLGEEVDVEAGLEFHGLVSGSVAAAQRELFKEGKELRDDWADLVNLERGRRVGAAVVHALERLDASYVARKRADGLLDFNDLEREGLRLLRGPAGEAVAAEYDHLLVDEYQDTSRIQEAILDCLARSAARFGVGDEKQSIYRFRYADAGVFRQLQREATAYPLAGSFRSRPEFVGFVNALFASLFEKRDVSPQDLHAAAEWREKESGPCVELIVAEGEYAGAARRDEARALARRLREIKEGEELRITNARKDDRPLTYADCALLLRATTHLSVYERALAEEGVPYVVIKGRGYYAAREVVDLAHLLLLLEDPSDEFRAIAALTSWMCGVPEGALVHLGGERPLPWRVRSVERPDAIDEQDWARLHTFADRFDRWRSLAERVETGDLIEAILDETRFADLMLLESDGRRRHANLHKALRRARRTADDPATFARALLDFREREIRESEAPIAAETDEAVKIMTVHASKGLEFPLVAVADLAAPPPRGGGPLLDPEGRFGFRLRDDQGASDPPGLTALKAWNQQQEENERLRLFYVALTRAEEHLLLSGALYPKANAEMIDRIRASESVLVREPEVASGNPARRANAAVRAALRRGVAMPAKLPRDDEGAREVLERIRTIQRPERDATPYVAAVADLVEFERCPRRYRLGRMLGIEIEEPADGEGDSERESRDAEEHPRRLLGTVFHEIMAEVGPGAVPDAACVERHMPESTEADRAKLIEWAEWFADTDLGSSLSGRDSVQCEMPFFTRIAGLPVRGVIDVYDSELPLLLDYKTGGRVRAEEYGVQVAIYLAAIRALGGRPPGCAHLVYVDAREIIEVEEQSLDPLVARFRNAHRGELHFPPLPGPACEHCDFRRACLAEGVKI